MGVPRESRPGRGPITTSRTGSRLRFGAPLALGAALLPAACGGAATAAAPAAGPTAVPQVASTGPRFVREWSGCELPEFYGSLTEKLPEAKVGYSNVVNATVEATAGGLARALVGSQQVSTGAGGDEVTAGQRVTLAIRPEKLTLQRPVGGRGEALTSAVQEIVYIGTDTRHVVGRPSGAVLAARLQNLGGRGRGPYAVGDQVKFSWAAQYARAFTA